MCLIVTLVMFVMSIQSFIYGDYRTGSLSLVIALGFGFMLVRNIGLTRCDRNASCNHFCMLPSWMTSWFSKKDK